MKSTRTLCVLLAASILALPVASFAKGKKGDKALNKLVRQYDTNANGVIDGDEVEALRKAFDADKTGPLKALDTDGDGMLSDSEIAAIKVKVKGKKKKNA